jgi:hypothetical protein
MADAMQRNESAKYLGTQQHSAPQKRCIFATLMHCRTPGMAADLNRDRRHGVVNMPMR